jgi:hypothetical protein
MKSYEVRVGNTYEVMVSGKLAPVKLTHISLTMGWYGVNTATGREVRVKTARKLRRCLDDDAARQKDKLAEERMARVMEVMRRTGFKYPGL